MDNLTITRKDIENRMQLLSKQRDTALQAIQHLQQEVIRLTGCLDEKQIELDQLQEDQHDDQN